MTRFCVYLIAPPRSYVATTCATSAARRRCTVKTRKDEENDYWVIVLRHTIQLSMFRADVTSAENFLGGAGRGTEWDSLVEPDGIEPTTSGLQSQRSPN